MTSKNKEKFPKVNILVLEDNESRVDHLREFFPDLNITWAVTVTEFQSYLQKGGWDTIILDHDLGTIKNEGPDGLTGTDAARTLKVDCPVVVWSWNSVGADRMISDLKRNGVRAIHVRFSRSFAVWMCSHPWFKDMLSVP